jgi:Mg-chelatase subunit ChlD
MLNRSRDAAAFISWDKNIDSFFDLTSDFTILKNKIKEVDSKGGTNLDVGLEAAINVLDKASNGESYKTIILLSDGHGEYTSPDDQDSPVNDARNKGLYNIHNWT